MFNRGIRLPFTLLGIPVILDWSFLLILPLLAWVIGSRVAIFAGMFDMPRAEELTEGVMPYLLGLAAALGLFLGVVLHELGHAVVARIYGVKVRSITLWFLGGVAQFEEMPRQRGAEAVVGIAGPIVSVALGGLCWLVLMVLSPGALATRFVLEYLLYMNIVLAVFNMLPALPLDGGRVLRSLLALKLPYPRATHIAGVVSRGLAILLGLVGLFSVNFFLLLVAMFIFMAVNAETSTTRIEDMLRGVPVRTIMNPKVITVPPDIRVAELTQRMLRDHHLGFPVVLEDCRVAGWVSIEDVQGKPPDMFVSEVMTRDVAMIGQEADAAEAFRHMTRDDRTGLVVTAADGRMAGIITKTDLLRLIRVLSVAPGSSPVEDEEQRGALLGDDPRVSMMGR